MKGVLELGRLKQLIEAGEIDTVVFGGRPEFVC